MHIDVLRKDKDNNGFPDVDDEDIRIINAVIMIVGKMLQLISLFLLMLFIFTGNFSFYFQVIGGRTFTCLRKLLYGAYLVYPIMAKIYLAQQDHVFIVTIGTMIYIYLLTVATAFAVSFVLYIFFECPVNDLLKILVSDVVRLLHKIVNRKQLGKDD